MKKILLAAAMGVTLLPLAATPASAAPVTTICNSVKSQSYNFDSQGNYLPGMIYVFNKSGKGKEYQLSPGECITLTMNNTARVGISSSETFKRSIGHGYHYCRNAPANYNPPEKKRVWIRTYPIEDCQNYYKT